MNELEHTSYAVAEGENRPISNARLAVLVLLGAEIMFFRGTDWHIPCVSLGQYHLAASFAGRCTLAHWRNRIKHSGSAVERFYYV